MKSRLARNQRGRGSGAILARSVSTPLKPGAQKRVVSRFVEPMPYWQFLQEFRTGARA